MCAEKEDWLKSLSSSKFVEHQEEMEAMRVELVSTYDKLWKEKDSELESIKKETEWLVSEKDEWIKLKVLEEQKNEKTGSVHEEMVLYSFLGVFVIFIVDSFARAGKYCR